MSIIVDGKKIAQEILDNLKIRVEKLRQNGVEIKLGVVLVGGDKPSQTYVRNKGKACEKVGIEFQLYNYSAEIETKELIAEVQKIQKDNNLSGLIIQLPLPGHIVTKKVINYIKPEIDVDCLTFFNLGKLLIGKNEFRPPTPGAIMEILNHHQIDLNGKYVTLVGRGELIGKPLANILFHEEVTFSVCNKSTKRLEDFTLNADVVISGVGKHNLITGKMIKPGAVVIDAGTSFVDGKMYGDLEFDSVAEVASLVTPTPGGVGPITVAKLLENTVTVAESCSVHKLNK